MFTYYVLNKDELNFAFTLGSTFLIDSDHVLNVGDEFPNFFPIVHLRLFCAFLGACLPVLVYLILLESGFSLFAALIASIFTIFGKDLHGTSSRNKVDFFRKWSAHSFEIHIG